MRKSVLNVSDSNQTVQLESLSSVMKFELQKSGS